MAWEPHGASGTLTPSPELETLQAQPGLALGGWLLKAQEVSFRLGSRGLETPCCEAQGVESGQWGRQEIRSEKWGQRRHSGPPRLCGCATGKEHPGLSQDRQPHLLPITLHALLWVGSPGPFLLISTSQYNLVVKHPDQRQCLQIRILTQALLSCQLLYSLPESQVTRLSLGVTAVHTSQGWGTVN